MVTDIEIIHSKTVSFSIKNISDAGLSGLSDYQVPDYQGSTVCNYKEVGITYFSQWSSFLLSSQYSL